MNIKIWDAVLLTLLFSLGGFFAYNEPFEAKTIWTFIGSGVVVTLFSIVLGWIVHKVLRISKRYNVFADKITPIISPVIIFSVFLGVLILSSGLIEYFRRY